MAGATGTLRSGTSTPCVASISVTKSRNTTGSPSVTKYTPPGAPRSAASTRPSTVLSTWVVEVRCWPPPIHANLPALMVSIRLGSSVLSPAPHTNRGRTHTVSSPSPFASRTSCSAFALVEQPPNEPLTNEPGAAGDEDGGHGRDPKPVACGLWPVACGLGVPPPATSAPRLCGDGHHPACNDRSRALVPREVRADARARRAFHDDQRRADRAAVHPRGSAGRRADRLPGRVPVHARRVPVDVPRPPLDDAPVRRLRHGRGDERALPLPARPRPDGAEHGVRHAQPDGPRLGPSALARRGGARGRRDR